MFYDNQVYGENAVKNDSSLKDTDENIRHMKNFGNKTNILCMYTRNLNG